MTLYVRITVWCAKESDESTYFVTKNEMVSNVCVYKGLTPFILAETFLWRRLDLKNDENSRMLISAFVLELSKVSEEKKTNNNKHCFKWWHVWINISDGVKLKYLLVCMRLQKAFFTAISSICVCCVMYPPIGITLNN